MPPDFSSRTAAGWPTFATRLESCTRYRKFNGWVDWLSLGWVGQNPKANSLPEWLFGASLVWLIPLLGGSLLQHEMLHTIQELHSGDALFAQDRAKAMDWRDCFRIELEAHLFGGPLIGIPAVVMLAGGLFAVVTLLLVLIYFAVRPWFG